jgi:hypothetical protein
MRVATTDYEEENTSRKSARRDGQTTASGNNNNNNTGAPPAVAAIVTNLLSKVAGAAASAGNAATAPSTPNKPANEPSIVIVNKGGAGPRSPSPIINTDLEKMPTIFSNGHRSEKECRQMLLSIEHIDPRPGMQLQGKGKFITDHLKKLAGYFSPSDPKPIRPDYLCRIVGKWTTEVLESPELDFSDMLGTEFVLRLKRLVSILESVINCSDRLELKVLNKRYNAYSGSTPIGGHFSIAAFTTLHFFERLCYEYIGRVAIALL